MDAATVTPPKRNTFKRSKRGKSSASSVESAVFGLSCCWSQRLFSRIILSSRLQRSSQNTSWIENEQIRAKDSIDLCFRFSVVPIFWRETISCEEHSENGKQSITWTTQRSSQPNWGALAISAKFQNLIWRVGTSFLVVLIFFVWSHKVWSVLIIWTRLKLALLVIIRLRSDFTYIHCGPERACRLLLGRDCARILRRPVLARGKKLWWEYQFPGKIIFETKISDGPWEWPGGGCAFPSTNTSRIFSLDV